MAKSEIVLGELGGGNGKTDVFTPSVSSFTEIELGFAPTDVFVWFVAPYQTLSNLIVRIFEYDIVNNKWYSHVNTTSKQDVSNTWLPTYFYVNGTKLYYKAYDSDYAVPATYVAIKSNAM